jgi:hypothetical protein
MSKQLKYILTFGSLFFVGFGGSWIVSEYESEVSGNRMIASAKLNSTAEIEKHLMPLVLTVQGPEKYPKNPRTKVTLRGTIRTPFPEFNVINYKWILPDEVEVVKGQVIGDIQRPNANQVYDIEIIVNGFDSTERKEISLIATTTDSAGTQLGNSAVITSRPEDSMENIASEMMIKAQAFKASQAKERLPASEDGQ